MTDIKTIERQSERSVNTLLGETRKHKVVFGFSSVLVFVGVMGGALVYPPSYESTALLLSQTDSLSGSNDGKYDKKAWQPPRTLAQIAQSDSVVRDAIAKVGLKQLVGSDAPRVSVFTQLRSLLMGAPPPAVFAVDSWLPTIQSQLDIRAEATSDIVTISYRNRNPAVAVAFTSAVVHAFIDTESVLYANPGTADFFKAERQHFEKAFSDASQKFADFSVRSGLFSPDEQRKNLLKEQSDLSVQIAKTREDVVSSQAKRASLNTQLRSLEAVAHSPWINSVVAAIGSNLSASPSSGGAQVGDPPQLLIKVYQDAIADLFKANSTASAALSMSAEQAANYSAIENRLRDLVKRKYEFDLLSRNLGQASADLAAISKREAEVQVSADLAKAKIQAVKVVQEASVRSRPVFPNYRLILIGNIIISIIVGMGAANVWSAWNRRTRRSKRVMMQAHY